MRTLIPTLNTELGYIQEANISELVQNDIHLFEHRNFNQYFAFSYFDTYMDFCKENQCKQSILSNCIAEIDTNNKMKKDTILIYVVPIETIDINKKIIMSIEEDKYYFKKAVLYYTQDELNTFQSQLENMDILDFMQNEAKNGIQFENFKNGKSPSYYALLMRLYIKLPYLNLFFEKDDLGLLDLKQEIKNRLTKKSDALPCFVENIKIIPDFNEYIETKLKEVATLE